LVEGWVEAVRATFHELANLREGEGRTDFLEPRVDPGHLVFHEGFQPVVADMLVVRDDLLLENDPPRLVGCWVLYLFVQIPCVSYRESGEEFAWFLEGFVLLN
jgi:hypothetical protein